MFELQSTLMDGPVWLQGNFFEAGLEATQGDLVGVADPIKVFQFCLGKVVLGDDHFGDGILAENVFESIECSKDRIATDVLALVSFIVVDEAHRAQIQAGIIDKFIQGMNAVASKTVDQDLSTRLIRGKMEILEDPERTPRSDQEEAQEVEIDKDHRPAHDLQRRDHPKDESRCRATKHNGLDNSQEVIDVDVAPGPVIQTG